MRPAADGRQEVAGRAAVAAGQLDTTHGHVREEEEEAKGNETTVTMAAIIFFSQIPDCEILTCKLNVMF